MSGLPSRGDDASINGIDVREQGNALRVATNTPHLVSLGTGRLSTAVTLHPIKQGRVTIGSDPTCDIYVAGTGVCSLHCRVENSHNVVTLYPTNGCTLLDGLVVDKPTRLSQGSMLTIGRSNYLRFNHPEEAKLMKSVLPGAHLSMAPIQFTPNEECGLPTDFSQHHKESTELHGYQSDTQTSKYNDGALNALERELDMTLKDLTRRKPPVAPRKPYKDLDQISDSNSDQDSLRSFGNDKPKNSIMAKVSKFEYYAKQQKIGRSQFYTNEDYSPKVFSSNSLTVNTPAKDVLGGKNAPSNYKNSPRVILNDSNAIDTRNCAYANVMIKNKISKIDDIVKNFDDQTKLKKVNNVPSEKQMNDVYVPNEKQLNASYVQNEKQINSSGVYPDEKHINDSFSSHAQVTNENYEPFVPVKGYTSNDKSFNQQVYTNEYSTNQQTYTNEYNSVTYANDYNTNEQTYGRINEVKHNEGKYHQPSPSFDRNPQSSPMYANSSPIYSPSSPLERSMQAETMRLQAYTDRLNDEKEQEAESARLEEILSMCAEYERQITCGTPSTPTEKRSQNKIITNGSLPRTIINPNFVQTSDGYFKFDTSQNRLQNSPISKSLPLQRNLSNYENVDTSPSGQITPQLTITNRRNYENMGSMDEIGIPITDFTSPIMIRKSKLNSPDLNGERSVSSPLASPYENVFYKPTMKPKSPNTQSPRTRIRTTFAHKNVSPPQYFIFPTPPPIEDDSKMLPNVIYEQNTKLKLDVTNADNSSIGTEDAMKNVPNTQDEVAEKKHIQNNYKCSGIEKQLSLDEEIPMIDDSDLINDLESRTSQITPEPQNENEITLKTLESHLPINQPFTPNKVILTEVSESESEIYDMIKTEVESSKPKTQDAHEVSKATKFDDVKRELMADIPELDEFEKDLGNNQRECVNNALSIDIKRSAGKDQVSDELRAKYDSLKESRRQLLTEIHKMKCKMTDIRSQEDDILRDLEMEKALIKGEYDSEIAILNIEQQNKRQLLEKAKGVEEEIRECKEKQEERQRELRDRVEIATLKVERIEQDLKKNVATIEELQNACDILDNETKLFEDLEFQHLEEESEMLAYREDLQNEIITLTNKIESQKSRIMTLKSEANNNLTSALEETKVLQADYVRLLNQVENMTSTVQLYERELKEIASKLNANSAQSPGNEQSINTEGRDSPSSDSDDPDVTNYKAHQKQLNEKFQSIDRMSQSMIVELGEKRELSDLIDSVTMNTDDDISNEGSPQRSNESPSKASTCPKERKGFWERNFDSLSRLKNKKAKTAPKVDIMSQSLNENMIFNNENIESDFGFQKFNSLKLSKNKNKQKPIGQTPVKSSSSSKIPTFAAFGKIIKKDSVNKKREESLNKENINCQEKSRYVKNSKSFNSDNKYSKARINISPEKNKENYENERCSYADSLEGEIEGSPTENSSNSNNNTITGHSINHTEHTTNIKHQQLDKVSDVSFANGPRILHRKSCGDEPGVFSVASDFSNILSDSGKVPSQDDIDRISMVTMQAPLLSNETDKNSMGRKTLDSLMEIQRNRVAMLEKEGCQVIENEREKISELKRRVQNETKMLWESERETNRASSKNEGDTNRPSSKNEGYTNRTSSKNEVDKTSDSINDSSENNDSSTINDRSSENNESLSRNDNSFLSNDNNVSQLCADGSTVRDNQECLDAVSSTTFPDNESSGRMTSSIEELQVRHSRTDSGDVERTARPLSDTSDISNDNALLSMAGGRTRSPYFARTDLQRPLTRYLPIDREDFDLRQHIESAGHQVELCPHVAINTTSCRGYLHKLGAKFHTWSKRWFVFDRDSKTFIYYSDKSEKKPRGGAYFQVIEEVYLDHGNSSRSPNPQTTFVVKTRQRRYYLMSPSGEAARIWIDVIFTGAQGYMEY